MNTPQLCIVYYKFWLSIVNWELGIMKFVRGIISHNTTQNFIYNEQDLSNVYNYYI